MRSLNPEEAALWARVASTIRPLSREKPSPEAAAKPEEAASVRPKPARATLKPAARRPPAAAADRPTTLDGSWDKRLRSGAIEPDRVLDLHGMNLDTALARDRPLARTGDRAAASASCS